MIVINKTHIGLDLLYIQYIIHYKGRSIEFCNSFTLFRPPNFDPFGLPLMFPLDFWISTIELILSFVGWLHSSNMVTGDRCVCVCVFHHYAYFEHLSETNGWYLYCYLHYICCTGQKFIDLSCISISKFIRDRLYRIQSPNKPFGFLSFTPSVSKFWPSGLSDLISKVLPSSNFSCCDLPVSDLYGLVNRFAGDGRRLWAHRWIYF